MKKDVFIIGAGIAGLTAAVYAIRYGMNVHICDNGMAGGQIMEAPSIENYPAMFGIKGEDFSENLFYQKVFHNLLNGKQDRIHRVSRAYHYC